MTATDAQASGRPAAESRPFDIVVMAASLGGLQAIGSVLTGLPAAFPTPVLVVQHGRRGPAESHFPEVLGNKCALPVHPVSDGQPLDTPGVSVVPAGMTAVVQDRRVRLSENHSRRPADALMTAVAPVCGRRAVAVVLTGRLDDGAAGARAIKRCGGRVLVQDPATAAARDMPANTLATGCVDFALDLEHIPAALISLAMAPGGAEMLKVPVPPWAKLGARPGESGPSCPGTGPA